MSLSAPQHEIHKLTLVDDCLILISIYRANTAQRLPDHQQSYAIVSDLHNSAQLNVDDKQYPKEGKGVSILPFSRNKDFVLRDNIFEIFRNRPNSPSKTTPVAVLYGRSGIAKSQLALEFACRRGETVEGSSIF